MPNQTSQNDQNQSHDQPNSQLNNQSNDMVDNQSKQTDDTSAKHTLELLEERAIVNKERVITGKVRISKRTESKVVHVPVELNEETLIIEIDSHGHQALFDGNADDVFVENKTQANPIQILINGEMRVLGNEPIELKVAKDVATISTQTYVAEAINIDTISHHHIEEVAYQLRHEVLDIDEKRFDTDDNVKKAINKKSNG